MYCFIIGQLYLLPDESLYGVLDTLSQKFEQAFAEDKPVWKIDKMPPTKLKAMMSALVPIALNITSVEGTWKLAQAKPQTSRAKVATKMLHYSDRKQISVGMELASLSALHQQPFTAASAAEDIILMFQPKNDISITSSPSETASISDGCMSYEKWIVVFIVILALFWNTSLSINLSQ